MPGLLERLRTQFGGAPATGSLLDRLRAQDEERKRRSPAGMLTLDEFKAQALEDRESGAWTPPEPEPPIVAYDALTKLGKRWALGAPAETVAALGPKLAEMTAPDYLATLPLRAMGADVPSIAGGAREAAERGAAPLGAWGRETLSEADAALQRAGAPAPVRTGALLTSEILGPEELLPGGAFAKALRGAARPATAVAPAIAPDMAELAARSLAIGEPEALAARIPEALPPSPLSGFSPPLGERLKTIAARGPDGSEVGYIRVAPEEAGYRVDDIRVPEELRRQGIGTALHREAERLYGPRVGPTLAMTPEGEALANSLHASQRVQQEALTPAPAKLETQRLVAPASAEAGFVNAGGIGGAIQGFFRRYFTWHGEMAPLGPELAPVAAEARIAARGAQAAEMHAAGRNLADFELAMKEFLAQKAPDWSPDDAIDYVSKYMTGQNQGDELTGGLRSATTAMRKHVDALSTQLQAEPGLLSENLKAVLGENMGSYLRREYQNFVNPAWQELVSPGGAERWRWDAARTHILDAKNAEGGFQYFDPGPPEKLAEWLPQNLQQEVAAGQRSLPDAISTHRGNMAERWLNQAVNRDTDSFMGIGAGLGRLDLGIFKARKEIPEAIEDYLGLIKEPEKRYAASVHRMAHDLATHQMLTKMRDAGLGKIFFDDKIHGAVPSHFVEIPGGANRHPLAGLRTTPEISDVVRGIGERAKDYAPWLRAYMVANSGTKIGKTALSVQSHARNMLSWGAFLMSNGHFGSLPIAQLPTSGAARQAWQALSLGKKVAKGGEVEKLLSKVVDHVTLIDGQRLALPEGIDAMRDLVGKGHRFGVFGESANASDLAHHLGVAKSVVGDRARRAATQLSESGLPGRALVATGRGGKKALQAGLAAYGAEDDFGKLIAWMAETRNYMKAYKQEIASGAMSTDDVLKLTSKIVRDTTPTQSLASPAVRALRDFPLIADFPTFYGEIFRNAKNIVKQGFQEMGSANPAIKKIGAQRLAGFTATLAVPMAVPTALALKAGVTQDQQEAIREHLPEYMRDGHFGVWSADHQAKRYEAFDFSFMFPYTVLTEPAMAVLGQGKWDEATWDERLGAAVAQSTEPFWGRSILAGTAFDIARGETSTGRAVRNEVEDLGPQVRDSLAYAAQQLQPGTSTTAGKILQAAGVTHNPYGRRLPTELLAVMGPRVIPIQVLSTEGRPGTIFYRARSVSEAVDGARTIYYQARRAPAPERDQARGRANAAWRSTWDETVRFLDSLDSLGVKPSATERELRDGGLPAWMIESLLARKFVPLTFKEDR